jgi:phosphate transport system protein
VIEGDKIVNRYEVEIDEFCTQIIAKRQPAAGDLRVIHTVIKTITDLERIGDEAEKIARMARSIEEANRNHLPRIELKHMENSAISMLRGALDAFARLDAAGAAAVVREDETVDNEFRSVLRQLITHMMEDPRSISRALDLLFVSKALERIGDHSKNMCEYVIYMVKGRDVRHIGVDRLEAEARS